MLDFIFIHYVKKTENHTWTKGINVSLKKWNATEGEEADITI